MVKLKKFSMEDLKNSFVAMSELEQALYIGGGKEYIFDGYGKLLETKENDLDYSARKCIPYYT